MSGRRTAKANGTPLFRVVSSLRESLSDLLNSLSATSLLYFTRTFRSFGDLKPDQVKTQHSEDKQAARVLQLVNNESHEFRAIVTGDQSKRRGNDNARRNNDCDLTAKNGSDGVARATHL